MAENNTSVRGRVSSLAAAGLAGTGTKAPPKSTTATKTPTKPTTTTTTKPTRPSITPKAGPKPTTATKTPTVPTKTSTTTTSPKAPTTGTKTPIRTNSLNPSSSSRPSTVPSKKPSVVPAVRKTPVPSSSTRPTRTPVTTRRPSTVLTKPSESLEPIESKSAELLAELTLLKEKNQEMSSLLEEKENLIQSKEEDLNLLRERLQKIETGLVTPEEPERDEPEQVPQEAPIQEAVLEDQLDDLKSKVQELEKERDQALESIRYSKQQLEDERLVLAKQQDEAEEILRDNMEKVREKLEAEKKELAAKILEKEAEIVRIKKDMDELRENIQDMHKSHQTRLTGLSNQINEQHANQIAALKEDYESQLSALQSALKKLEEPNEDTEKAVAEQQAQLLARIQELESLSVENKAEFEKTLSDLKAQSKTQYEELALAHQQELESVSKALRDEIESLKSNYTIEVENIKSAHQKELGQVQIAINENEINRIRLESQQQSREQFDKELSSVKEEHESILSKIKSEQDRIQKEIESLKSSHDTELNQLKIEYDNRMEDIRLEERERVKTEYENKLSELEASHALALQQQDTQSLIHLQTQLDSLKAQHAQQLQDLTHDHSHQLKETKNAAITSTRIDTERQLRQTFDNQIEQLSASHNQAIQQLQSHHASRMEKLETELKLEIERQAAIAQAHQAQIESHDLGSIRDEVENALRAVHQSELARTHAEHESHLNSLKRDYVLQRDRERALVEERHAADLADRESSHREAVLKLEAEHRVAFESQLRQLQEGRVASAEVLAAHDQFKTQVKALEKKHQAELDVLKKENEKLQVTFNNTIASLQESHTKQIDTLESRSVLPDRLPEQEVLKIQQEHQLVLTSRLQELERSHAAALDSLRQEHEQNLKEMERLGQEKLEDSLDQLKCSHQSQLQQERDRLLADHLLERQGLEKEMKGQVEAIEEAHERAMGLAQIELENQKGAVLEAERRVIALQAELESQRAALASTGFIPDLAQLEKLQRAHQEALDQIEILRSAGSSESSDVIRDYSEKMARLEEANQKTIQALKDKLEEAGRVQQETVEHLTQEHNVALGQLKLNHQASLDQELSSCALRLGQDFDLQIKSLNEKHADELRVLSESHQKVLEELLAEKDQEVGLYREKYQMADAQQKELQLELASLIAKHHEALGQVRQQHERNIQVLNEEHELAKQQLNVAHEETLQSTVAAHQETLKLLKEDIDSKSAGHSDKVKSDLKESFDQQLNEISAKHEVVIQELKKEHEDSLRKLQARAKLQSESLRSEIEDELAEGYEAQINKLVKDHNISRQRLENEIKESVAALETAKIQFKNDKVSLESQYREKINLLQIEYQQERENSAQNNESITERMQKEIESIQLTWQEEQQKLISKLQADHKSKVDILESKLAKVLKELEETKAESVRVETYRNEARSAEEKKKADIEEAIKNKDKQLKEMNERIKKLQSETQRLSVDSEDLRTLKISYEKMIAAKDKEIKEVEDRLQETSRGSISKSDDGRVQAIVSQHQREIKVLQTQFQQMLDLKDKELEGFSYRLKTLTTSQQKDLEKLHEDHKKKIAELEALCQAKEESIKSKSLEMRWMAAEFESSEVKLKDQSLKMSSLEKDNNGLRQHVQQYKEENEQMLRLIHQLQSEMHHIH